MKKYFLILIIATFSFIGCGDCSDCQPAVPGVEVNATTIRFDHDDLKLFVPLGFDMACHNCHPGFTSKVVCGENYNAECNGVSTDNGN